MKLLDLFCGAGGAAMGYHRAGFDVVGVDINRQPHYPFTFIQADAMTFPLAGYDLIHASPPCQSYTRKAAHWGRKRTHFIQHPDYIADLRKKLEASGIPWIIENVPGAPLYNSLMLCGTMFDLKIRKHRIFESNLPLPLTPRSCYHVDLYNPWSGAGRSAQKHRDAQDTPWIPTSGGASRKKGITGDLYNAIPPAYTEFIGKQLLTQLNEGDTVRVSVRKER